MTNIQWPQDFHNSQLSGRGYYNGSAICLRGHVETNHLSPTRDSDDINKRCAKCGALVFVACPSCNFRIRGAFHSIAGFTKSVETCPSFCDQCGKAFAWASREERIFELENLLFENEELEESHKDQIRANMEHLKNMDLALREQEKRWLNVVRITGKTVLTNPRILDLITSLTDAAMRAQMGLH